MKEMQTIGGKRIIFVLFAVMTLWAVFLTLGYDVCKIIFVQPACAVAERLMSNS
jgi:hypothetical protein